MSPSTNTFSFVFLDIYGLNLAYQNQLSNVCTLEDWKVFCTMFELERKLVVRHYRVQEIERTMVSIDLGQLATNVCKLFCIFSNQNVLLGATALPSTVEMLEFSVLADGQLKFG